MEAHDVPLRDARQRPALDQLRAGQPGVHRLPDPQQRVRVQRPGAGRGAAADRHPARRHGPVPRQAGRHLGHHRRGVEPGAPARVQPGRLPAVPEGDRQGRGAGRPGGARPAEDHRRDPGRDWHPGQLLQRGVDVRRDLPGERGQHGGAEAAAAHRQQDRGHVGGGQEADLARHPGGGARGRRPEELCVPDVRLHRGVPRGQHQAVEAGVGRPHQPAEAVPGREAVRARLRDLLRADPVAEPGQEEEEVLQQEKVRQQDEALEQEEAPRRVPVE